MNKNLFFKLGTRENFKQTPHKVVSLLAVSFLFFFIFILSISLSSAQTIQPILRYEFESIEGGNTIVDKMGNYNGTIVDGGVSLITGNIGGGVYVDSGKTILLNNLANYLNGKTNITFSYWTNSTQLTSGVPLAFDIATIMGNDEFFGNYTQIDVGVSNVPYLCHGNSYFVSGWTNYVIKIDTLKDLDEKVTVYQNGIPMTMSCEPDNENFSQFVINNDLQIGFGGFSEGMNFDEYRIYDRVLTDAQIMRLYTNPSGDITESSSCPKVNCKDKRNRNNPMCMNYNNSKPFVQLCKGSNF